MRFHATLLAWLLTMFTVVVGAQTVVPVSPTSWSIDPTATYVSTQTPWTPTYTGNPKQPALYPIPGSATGWQVLFPETSYPTYPGWIVKLDDPTYVNGLPGPINSWLGYITTKYTKAIPIGVGHYVIFTANLLSDPTAEFRWDTENYNNCYTQPAHARLLVVKAGDKGTNEFGRWWSNPVAMLLDASVGQMTVITSLTPDQWSSVYGRKGTDSAKALSGFQAAMGKPGQIGLTLGGGCFFGHGVFTAYGQATLQLVSMQIH